MTTLAAVEEIDEQSASVGRLRNRNKHPKIVSGAMSHTAGTRKLRRRLGSIRRNIITATATIRKA
jgi:hypothetical protein